MRLLADRELHPVPRRRQSPHDGPGAPRRRGFNRGDQVVGGSASLNDGVTRMESTPGAPTRSARK